MEVKNTIEIKGLYKKFKLTHDKPNTLKERLTFFKREKVTKKTILFDINLDIKKGETVALIGTNGSGKSTLLKLMTKILYPNQGSLHTYGKLTSLLELGAGFHPDFTGRENIYFNASIFGLTRNEIDKRIDEIINFSELYEFIDNPIRTYSSGMYMRLAFSIAINVDADILLLDEILAVGDQHFQEKCYNKLKELRSSDKTIVIVSHSLDIIKDLCDRAIWLYQGKVKMDGTPDYVVDAYLKQVAMDHKKQIYELREKGIYNLKGTIFFDSPSAFSKVNDDTIVVRGWSLANIDDVSLKLYVNKQEVLITNRERRDDVFNAYREEYIGTIEVDSIGFFVEIAVEDFVNHTNELNIEMVMEDDKGNRICNREMIVYLNKESSELDEIDK